MNNHKAFRIVIIATLIILLMSTSAMAVGRSDRFSYSQSHAGASQNKLNTTGIILKPMVIPTLAFPTPTIPSSGTEDSGSIGINPTPVTSSEKSYLSSRIISRPSRIPLKDIPPSDNPTATPTDTPTPISYSLIFNRMRV